MSGIKSDCKQSSKKEGVGVNALNGGENGQFGECSTERYCNIYLTISS